VGLRQIQGLDPQPLQRIFRVSTDRGRVKIFRPPRRAPATQFGRHKKRLPLPALTEKGPDQTLASPIAINVGRVDESDAGIRGRVQGLQGLGIRHVPPFGPPDLPTANAHFRNGRATLTKVSIVHEIAF
jgi:hypothetical protein